MKRRQAPPVPVDDPKRRRWTSSALRIRGFFALEANEALRSAWSTAWRTFEDGRGPCPVGPDGFAAAVLEWPQRTTYPALIEDWRLRQTNAPRRLAK